MSNQRCPKLAFLWIAPSLLPIAAALAFMVLYSTGGIGLLSHGWTLQFWKAVLFDSEIWRSLAYSFALGLLSISVSLVLALLLLALLGSHARRGILDGLFHIPLAIPPLVASLLSVVLFSNSGVFARFSYALGWLERPEQFPSPLYDPAGFGIVLTYALLVAPFLLLLLGRLEHNEGLSALIALARTLGASPWQAWRRVQLPILLKAAMPTLTIYFIVLAGSFEVPLMLGSSHPQMIAVLIQRQITQFDLSARPQAFVSASLYSLFATGMLLVLVRWTKRFDWHLKK